MSIAMKKDKSLTELKNYIDKKTKKNIVIDIDNIKSQEEADRALSSLLKKIKKVKDPKEHEKLKPIFHRLFNWPHI